MGHLEQAADELRKLVATDSLPLDGLRSIHEEFETFGKALKVISSQNVGRLWAEGPSPTRGGRPSRCKRAGRWLEAGSGIEPLYEVLQTSA
jgi:hypothetical protein